EQTQIIAGRGDLVEEPSCVVLPAHHLIDGGEPERAGEGDPFVAGETVDIGLRLEAKQQPILEKLALERLDGADNTRIGRRKESGQRYEQKTGVQSRAAVVLREGVELSVEPVAAHLLEDGSAGLAKVVDRLVETVLFRISDRPIDGGPRRHLRSGE